MSLFSAEIMDKERRRDAFAHMGTAVLPVVSGIAICLEKRPPVLMADMSRVVPERSAGFFNWARAGGGDIIFPDGGGMTTMVAMPSEGCVVTREKDGGNLTHIATTVAPPRPPASITPSEYAQIEAELDDIKDRLGTPRIVCICGSTRFWAAFQMAGLQETVEGRIVLSIVEASGTDDHHFGNMPPDDYKRVKDDLDILHLRKIDIADEVLVLNVGGYIGESMRREIEHALARGKPVRYMY